MNLYVISFLALLMCKQQFATACNDCQDLSDCNDCNDYIGCDNCCESSGCNTNCRSVTSCCNICQKRCSTRSCRNNCRRKCCPSCDTDPTPDTSSSPGVPTQVPIIPSSSSSSKTENNIVSTFNINNVINTENRIHIPVHINTENQQSVQLTSSYNSSTACEKDCPPTPAPTPGTSCNDTECTPHTIRVPVPVPIPFPVKVPVMIRVPVPRPSRHCCIIVSPCIDMGCKPYRHECGNGCSGSYFYDHSNPCEGGCHKRSGFNSRVCDGYGQCYDKYMDCGGCNEDSFSSFGGYQQCGGCFYR